MPEDKPLGEAFDWDTPTIDNPDEGSEYIVLTPGRYRFTVKLLKRAQFNGSEKMCSCPQAIVTLDVENDKGTVMIDHNLYLNYKCKGLIAEFFTAIGLHKKGEPLNLAWNQIVGRSGEAEIDNRVYKDKTYNNVKKFINPAKAGAAQTSAPQAPAADQDEIPF